MSSIDSQITRFSKKYGVDREVIKMCLDSLSKKSDDLSSIKVGDKVRINRQKITSRKHYPRTSETYRDFVESNYSKSFTVASIKDSVVEFREDPNWLFVEDDLIKIKM